MGNGNLDLRQGYRSEESPMGLRDTLNAPLTIPGFLKKHASLCRNCMTLGTLIGLAGGLFSGKGGWRRPLSAPFALQCARILGRMTGLIST